MMESIQEWLAHTATRLSDSRAIGAIVVLIGFLIAAKITDLFFERIVLSLVKMTRFKLDDAIIKVFHRPIRSTIVLIGAIWAVRCTN